MTVHGVQRNTLTFGIATTPRMLRHAGDESAHQCIPELEDGFVGWPACDAAKGNFLSFHHIDSNLNTVTLEEEVEMLQGFVLLVSSGGQKSVVGMAAENTCFLVFRHGVNVLW